MGLMNNIDNKINYVTIYNKQQYYDSIILKGISVGIKIFG